MHYLIPTRLTFIRLSHVRIHLFVWILLTGIIAPKSALCASDSSALPFAKPSLQTNSYCSNGLLAVNINTTGVKQIIWKKDGAIVSTGDLLLVPVTMAGGIKGTDAGSFCFPAGVCMDDSGSIYVADQYNHRVQKWLPGATAGITVAGGNGKGNASNQLDNPYAVAVDKQGNVFVTDVENNRVQKWTPGAKNGITVAGMYWEGSADYQFSYPTGICIDDKGALYISDSYNHRVQKWLPGATAGITVAGGNGMGSDANQLRFPMGLSIDAKGTLYIADALNDRIQKWPAGADAATTVAGGNGRGAASNQFSYPTDIKLDDNGNMYIADVLNQRIQYWINGDKAGTTVAGGNGQGNAANQLICPNSLCLDKNRNLYVSDEYNHRIQLCGGPDPVIKTTWFAKTPGSYEADIIYKNGMIVPTDLVVINSLPDAGHITGADNVCPGYPVTFTNVITNGNWSTDNATANIDKNGSFRSPTGGKKVTVTYTVSDDKGCSSFVTKTVNILNPQQPAVLSGITRLEIKNATQLISNLPGGRWLSADTSIAGITTDGLVTAVSPGTTHLIYQPDDLSACPIDASIPFTALPLQPVVRDSIYYISSSNTSVRVAQQVKGADGVRFDFFNSLHSTDVIDTPVIVGSGAHTFWVSQSVNGISSNKVAFRATVIQVDTFSTQHSTINDQEFNTGNKLTKHHSPSFNISVFPNPAIHYFNIKLQSKENLPVSITIMDVAGKVMDARNNIDGNSNVQIGENYSNGTYFMAVKQGVDVRVLKLLKIR